MSLVTLETAKSHLRIEASFTLDDADITRKAAQASAIVIDYLKKPADMWQDTPGDPLDVPAVVEAAVLLVLGALYENREGVEGAQNAQPLSQAAKDLVHRFRDPALA